MPALVSVIVPVYRVEEYLSRCVDSLLAQTLDDIDILLVDDGSPDRCGEICDRYATHDPEKVRVLHKENGGLSDARNFGLKAAVGEYVLFVDSDDYIAPDACEKLYARARACGADVVAGNAVAVTRDGEFPIRRSRLLSQSACYTPEEYLPTELSGGLWWRMAWMNLYRTAFLVQNGLWFPKGLLHEDEEWTPRVILSAGKIAYCDTLFYYYVLREGSITQAKNFERNIADSLSIYRGKLQSYRQIKDPELKGLLLDDLVRSLLHAYVRLHMYESPQWKNALDGLHLWKYCRSAKTRLKVLLFACSKNGYVRLNRVVKKDAVL